MLDHRHVESSEAEKNTACSSKSETHVSCDTAGNSGDRHSMPATHQWSSGHAARRGAKEQKCLAAYRILPIPLVPRQV